VLPGRQWLTRHEGEGPLSWFAVPCMVSRHTWSTRSYQRVSTFTSGSSSVSRMRRRAVMLVVRVRPARGGNSSENSPHYREAKKSTNVRDEIEKSFESKIRTFNASLTGSTSP
jgi:hypothetical protein